MTAETSDNRSLQIQRIIKAPRDRVYAAWTDPAQLQQWFGPDGVKTRSFEADPRVGGRYSWHLVNQDNEEMTVHGEYRELKDGRKIVFTWQWEDDEAWKEQSSVVTVELSDCEGGTLVRLSHQQLPSQASRDRHNQGWTGVLDNLETFLTK